jgi:FKBP-type peptidyl-prolyl cis-trans isomerase FklB
MSMQKPLTAIVMQILAAGMMLAGNLPAQQTPAAATPTTPTAAPKTAQSSAAKKPATGAKPGAAPVILKTEKDKESYALGMKIGSDLKRQGVGSSVDAAIMARALRDAITGGKTAITEDEMKKLLGQLQTEVQQKRQAEALAASETNRKEGEAFLAANKAKPGVVTLPSGLQYKVLTQGNGAKPTATDTVSCNYRGTLINGKEFDSSFRGGKPVSFPVSGVIKGWTEALQLMPVGSKWQLFIPPDLAYGDRGAGNDIGPGSTLVFEVELLSIAEKKEEPKKDEMKKDDDKKDAPKQ